MKKKILAVLAVISFILAFGSAAFAAPFDQVVAPDFGVEQDDQAIGVAVADARHHVSVHHVVDVGHMLVADALDVVLAEAVLQERRAFGRLGNDDLGSMTLLEMVAGRQRAARSRRV